MAILSGNIVNLKAQEIDFLRSFNSTSDVNRFEVHKDGTLYVLNASGAKTAVVHLYHNETQVLDKGYFGDERFYKGVQSAVRNLARRYNNLRRNDK